MQYRAVIKKSDGWWIGWLIDLPGVNAQEKTKKELLESLKIGAEDMLNTPLDQWDYNNSTVKKARGNTNER